jgi:hypothetical protein
MWVLAAISVPILAGVGAACLMLVAIGVVRRGHGAAGSALIAAAGATAVVFAISGDLRPTLLVVGIVALSEGVGLDQRGHRAIAILSLALGLLALLSAVFAES